MASIREARRASFPEQVNGLVAAKRAKAEPHLVTSFSISNDHKP